MEYGACENIEVDNCTLISTSAAIKLGTESEALFRNIKVTNCNIYRSNSGISLQLRDKGCMEDITFSNINIETRMFSKKYWWGEAEPIAITAVKRYQDTMVGYVKNIRFQNIRCNGENGILIYGDASKNIKDISFEAVSIHLKKITDWPKCYHDLRPNDQKDIIEDSLRAVYICNALDIRFHGFELTIDTDMKKEIVEAVFVEECGNVLSDLQEAGFFDKIESNIS